MLAEAMACGVPVVATASPGPPGSSTTERRGCSCRSTTRTRSRRRSSRRSATRRSAGAAAGSRANVPAPATARRPSRESVHERSPGPRRRSSEAMRRALLVAAFTAVLALPVVAAARDRAEPPTWNRDVGPIVLLWECPPVATQAGGGRPFALTGAATRRRHATRRGGRRGRADAAVDAGPRVTADTSARDATAEPRPPKATIAAGRLGRPRRTGNAPGGRARRPRRPLRTITLTPSGRTTPNANASDDYHCFVLDPGSEARRLVDGRLDRPRPPRPGHHMICSRLPGARRHGRAPRPRLRRPRLDLLRRPHWASTWRHPTPVWSGSPQWLAAWVPGRSDDSLPGPRGSRPRRCEGRNAGALQPRERRRDRPLAHPPPPRPHRQAPSRRCCSRRRSSSLCPPARPAARTREAGLAHLRTDYGSSFLPDALLAFCGRANVTATTTSCIQRADRPLTVYGVAGHMHVRGRDIRVVVDPGTPDDGRCCRCRRGISTGRTRSPFASPSASRPARDPASGCRFANSGDATSSGAREPRTRCAWGCSRSRWGSAERRRAAAAAPGSHGEKPLEEGAVALSATAGPRSRPPRPGSTAPPATRAPT